MGFPVSGSLGCSGGLSGLLGVLPEELDGSSLDVAGDDDVG